MAGSEIERKHLLRELPDDVAALDGVALRQGYVALDGDTEVRVRLTPDEATLTIKHGGGRVRVEEELPLDRRQAEALWQLTEGRRVEKVRRRVPLDDGLVAEVDVYEGLLAGLCVVEVEFPDEDAAERFDAPPWFGPDVTDDRAYANRRLAVDGRPSVEGIA